MHVQTQERMTAVVQYMQDLTIVDENDTEGYAKALKAMKVAVKIRTTSEAERKAAKNQVDLVYKNLFGGVAIEEKTLGEKIDVIDQINLERVRKQEAEEEVVFQKRKASLEKTFGMQYDAEHKEMYLEDVRIDRLFLATADKDSLLMYLKQHVIPVHTRLKKEQEERAKQEAIDAVQRIRDAEELAALRLPERLKKLEAAGLRYGAEEMALSGGSLSFSFKEISSWPAEAFELRLQGIEAEIKKRAPKPQEEAMGTRVNGPIPSAAIQPKKGVMLSLEGQTIDRDMEVETAKSALIRVEFILAALDSFKSEIGKKAAMDLGHRVKYIRDYLIGLQSDL